MDMDTSAPSPVCYRDNNSPSSPKKKVAHCKRVVNCHRSVVRRCLFGPVDHNSLDFILKEEMHKATELCQLKWNFDFEVEAGMPDGRYQWSKCEKGEDIPGVYRRGYRVRIAKSRRFLDIERVKRRCNFDLDENDSKDIEIIAQSEALPADGTATKGNGNEDNTIEKVHSNDNKKKVSARRKKYSRLSTL